jgi:hypothetical protein
MTFKLPAMLNLVRFCLFNFLFRECKSLLPYGLNRYYHFLLKNMYKRLSFFAASCRKESETDRLSGSGHMQIFEQDPVLPKYYIDFLLAPQNNAD